MVGGLQGEEWKFIQKYLKKRSKRVSAQISGKLQEEFHNTVQNGCETISQQKGDFAMLCKILPSACSDWLAMAVTPSVQL